MPKYLERSVLDLHHIKEDIWIRRRTPNRMNRDEGAHYLSHILVYDPLLTIRLLPIIGRSRRVDQVPA